MPYYDFKCEVCGRLNTAWRPEEKGPPRFCSTKCRQIGMVGEKTKPQKYNITPQIHKKIKELYQTPGNRGEVKKYAKEINMPSWKLSRYAMRQGWRKKMKKTIPWSEKEKDFLRKHARYCSSVLQ